MTNLATIMVHETDGGNLWWGLLFVVLLVIAVAAVMWVVRRSRTGGPNEE